MEILSTLKSGAAAGAAAGVIGCLFATGDDSPSILNEVVAGTILGIITRTGIDYFANKKEDMSPFNRNAISFGAPLVLRTIFLGNTGTEYLAYGTSALVNSAPVIALLGGAAYISIYKPDFINAIMNPPAAIAPQRPPAAAAGQGEQKEREEKVES